MNYAEKLEEMHRRGRIAVARADAETCRLLARELQGWKKDGLVRLTLPEPENFGGFLNGAMNTMTQAMGFRARYEGTVLMEMAGDYRGQERMALAAAELMEITACGPMLFVARDAAGEKILLQAVAHIGVPARLELSPEAALDPKAALSRAARQQGASFSGPRALKQAAEIYERIRKSPVFRLSAFLTACAGPGGEITCASIAAEKDAPEGYFRLAEEWIPAAGEGEKAGGKRPLGFLTLSERAALGEKARKRGKERG